MNSGRRLTALAPGSVKEYIRDARLPPDFRKNSSVASSAGASSISYPYCPINPASRPCTARRRTPAAPDQSRIPAKRRTGAAEAKAETAAERAIIAPHYTTGTPPVSDPCVAAAPTGQSPDTSRSAIAIRSSGAASAIPSGVTVI